MNLENCRYLYLKALRGHRALPYVPARDSLTHYRALPEAILAGRQEKGALAWHIVGTFQHLNLIQDFMSGMFMWS